MSKHKSSEKILLKYWPYVLVIVRLKYPLACQYQTCPLSFCIYLTDTVSQADCWSKSWMTSTSKQPTQGKKTPVHCIGSSQQLCLAEHSTRQLLAIKTTTTFNNRGKPSADSCADRSARLRLRYRRSTCAAGMDGERPQRWWGEAAEVNAPTTNRPVNTTN